MREPEPHFAPNFKPMREHRSEHGCAPAGASAPVRRCGQINTRCVLISKAQQIKTQRVENSKAWQGAAQPSASASVIRRGRTHRRIGAVLQRFGKQADRLMQALAQNYRHGGALFQTPALH
jgi:hypothetical protein